MDDPFAWNKNYPPDGWLTDNDDIPRGATPMFIIPITSWWWYGQSMHYFTVMDATAYYEGRMNS
jgi:hypothetical protein